MKRELPTLYYETAAEARGAIFSYNKAFYNRQRGHSTPGYLSPEVFEITGVA